MLTDQYSLAEIITLGDSEELPEDPDGLVWKEALKTGTCATTPGPNQTPNFKPLIVKLDTTEPREISLNRILDNFASQAVEHVTVPLSHADRVDENTGYVRKLKIEPDPSRPGEHRLMAGFEFTEPDIKGKVKRGSIANNSVGILFDHVRKMDGKKYDQVLAHIALTNRPWIGGLAPFGVAASEVAYFSQDEEVLLGSGASLAKTPEKDNWVDQAGELPRYVREVARSLHKKRGMTLSRAIATAISRIKVWAVKSTDPSTKAKAVKALAQWNALKAKSHAKSGTKVGMSDEAFIAALNLGEGALDYSEADFADREDMASLSLAEAQVQRTLELSVITDAPSTEVETAMAELTPEELAARLAELETENSTLRAEKRRDAVMEKIQGYSEDWGDHPVLLTTVRDILLSDDAGTALLLSEHDDSGDIVDPDAAPTKMSATQIVERLMDALPQKPEVQLSEQATATPATKKPPADASDEVKEVPHAEKVKQAEAWLAGQPMESLTKPEGE